MITQEELIKEYYFARPNLEIHHSEVVPWLMEEYQKRTGKVFADPDRGIRKLSQKGFLVKISKGIYKYDSTLEVQRELEDFTEKQKVDIKERDGYKCVICGLGIKDGVELQVDHIKPKELGGKATLENGQTLCAKHNYLKKTLKQTETGKKMFINLYKLAIKENNEELQEFCIAILEVFEHYNMNGHIEWKKH